MIKIHCAHGRDVDIPASWFIWREILQLGVFTAKSLSPTVLTKVLKILGILFYIFLKSRFSQWGTGQVKKFPSILLHKGGCLPNSTKNKSHRAVLSVDEEEISSDFRDRLETTSPQSFASLLFDLCSFVCLFLSFLPFFFLLNLHLTIRKYFLEKT